MRIEIANGIVTLYEPGLTRSMTLDQYAKHNRDAGFSALSGPAHQDILAADDSTVAAFGDAPGALTPGAPKTDAPVPLLTQVMAWIA